MELRYLNGEKVYVEDKNQLRGFDNKWTRGEDTSQVCRHRDIIKALNRMLKKAEESPDNVENLWNLIFHINLHCDHSVRIPVEIMDKASLKFDDPKKVKLSKMPRLKQSTKSAYHGTLSVITGGLYKPSDRPTYQADDLISDEFKKWQREQREK